MPVSADVLDALRHVTTATCTTVLLKKGLRNTWVRGAVPIAPGQPRTVGPAFTLRFVPYREDLAGPQSWSSPRSTRACVEAMPAGAMVVIDAMGDRQAGVFGDILCQRMVARGVAGMATDGVVRDSALVAATGLATWCAGRAGPPAVAAMHFAGWGEVVACGGVCVMPDDVIVADDDGAVVIPADLAETVATEGTAQEDLEEWIMEEVRQGAGLPGLYPPNEETLARYRAKRGG